MNTSMFSQERIVIIAAALIAVLASVSLSGFLNVTNAVTIVRSISVLGIFALGMAIVVIGRGIDLSMVAVMAMSVAWYLQMLNTGRSELFAFSLVLLAVVFIGLVNGFLVAYVRVPPIFVTLATGLFVFGFVRSQLIPSDAIAVPNGHWLEAVGKFRLAGLPADVIVFIVLSLLVFLFLRFTKWGRYAYFAGDNPVTARITGIPVRPMILLRYTLAALFSFIAGLLTAASLLSIQTRVINSSLLYDIILVVVIGGIGLSGGKGGVRNVLVGAALIGILLNALTIADVSLLFQNLIKSAILLVAIILDGVLNPRDEQTAQQGDI